MVSSEKSTSVSWQHLWKTFKHRAASVVSVQRKAAKPQFRGLPLHCLVVLMPWTQLGLRRPSQSGLAAISLTRALGWILRVTCFCCPERGLQALQPSSRCFLTSAAKTCWPAVLKIAGTLGRVHSLCTGKQGQDANAEGEQSWGDGARASPAQQPRGKPREEAVLTLAPAASTVTARHPRWRPQFPGQALAQAASKTWLVTQERAGNPQVCHLLASVPYVLLCSRILA